MTRPAYTVVWEPELTADFTQVWIEANTERREFLTRVAHLIDRTLGSAPEDVGRPWKDAFLWSPANLNPVVGVVFEQSTDDRIVKVSQILIVESADTAEASE